MKKEELTSKDSDLFSAYVVVVCFIAFVLLLFLAALTGCSSVPQPKPPQRIVQIQNELKLNQEPYLAAGDNWILGLTDETIEQRKERILNQLRTIFYGDDVSMYLAIERAQTKRSK